MRRLKKIIVYASCFSLLFLSVNFCAEYQNTSGEDVLGHTMAMIFVPATVPIITSAAVITATKTAAAISFFSGLMYSIFCRRSCQKNKNENENESRIHNNDNNRC